LTLFSIQCYQCQKMKIETQCNVNVTENFNIEFNSMFWILFSMFQWCNFCQYFQIAENCSALGNLKSYFMFSILSESVILVIKMKIYLSFLSKYIKPLKHWINDKNWEAVWHWKQTLSNLSIYLLWNIELNTMSVIQNKTLKTYSVSMSIF